MAQVEIRELERKREAALMQLRRCTHVSAIISKRFACRFRGSMRTGGVYIFDSLQFTIYIFWDFKLFPPTLDISYSARNLP